MTKEYIEATATHDLYKTYNSRWTYLLQSYMGGEFYKKAELLTKYQYETPADYADRIAATPLDNHCRGVINVYNSFLFREGADREFGSLSTDPAVYEFLEDADLEGRTLDAFMKDVATWASVFGSCWIMVSKPQTNARTRADELNQGVRPYVSLMTPLAVLDWRWTRAANGYFYLTYLKIIEDGDYGNTRVVKEWTETDITTWLLDEDQKEVMEKTVEPNGLGVIPAVLVYSQKSPFRGIGISDIDDIADQQRAIYNEYSEIEQSIRIQGHPSLVKTADVEATAGAGAIVQMPDNLDPGLKPYLLEPNAQNVDSIYLSIKNRIESIDRMANMGSVRTNSTQAMSGVSREVEFQLLNARLSEKADNLELAEEQMWRLFAQYQGRTWDGSVEYPDNFGVHDKKNELEKLQMAMALAANDPQLQRVIEFKVRDIVIDDETPESIQEDQVEQQAVIDELNNGLGIQPTTDAVEVAEQVAQDQED